MRWSNSSVLGLGSPQRARYSFTFSSSIHALLATRSTFIVFLICLWAGGTTRMKILRLSCSVARRRAACMVPMRMLEALSHSKARTKDLERRAADALPPSVACQDERVGGSGGWEDDTTSCERRRGEAVWRLCWGWGEEVGMLYASRKRD